MFKLSKKADYGLIAVKHLAMHRQEHACSANEIAEEYGISVTLMAKVLQTLGARRCSGRETRFYGRISTGERPRAGERARRDLSHRWPRAHHILCYESREL